MTNNFAKNFTKNFRNMTEYYRRSRFSKTPLRRGSEHQWRSPPLWTAFSIRGFKSVSPNFAVRVSFATKPCRVGLLSRNYRATTSFTTAV
jgi:hypothetical protein